MAKPLQAPLPQLLDLPSGFTLEFAAVDPDTGADVAGVLIENATLTATNAAGETVTLGGEQLGPFMLVPGPGSGLDAQRAELGLSGYGGSG